MGPWAMRSILSQYRPHCHFDCFLKTVRGQWVSGQELVTLLVRHDDTAHSASVIWCLQRTAQHRHCVSKMAVINNN